MIERGWEWRYWSSGGVLYIKCGCFGIYEGWMLMVIGGERDKCMIWKGIG